MTEACFRFLKISVSWYIDNDPLGYSSSKGHFISIDWALSKTYWIRLIDTKLWGREGLGVEESSKNKKSTESKSLGMSILRNYPGSSDTVGPWFTLWEELAKSSCTLREIRVSLNFQVKILSPALGVNSVRGEQEIEWGRLEQAWHVLGERFSHIIWHWQSNSGGSAFAFFDLPRGFQCTANAENLCARIRLCLELKVVDRGSPASESSWEYYWKCGLLAFFQDLVNLNFWEAGPNNSHFI